MDTVHALVHWLLARLLLSVGSQSENVYVVCITCITRVVRQMPSHAVTG